MENLEYVDFRTSLSALSLYDSVNCLTPDICFLIHKIWLTATASVKASLEPCDVIDHKRWVVFFHHHSGPLLYIRNSLDANTFKRTPPSRAGRHQPLFLKGDT